MFNSIEEYLKALKLALKGSDAALIQDALNDAESHLRQEQKQNPDVNLNELIQKFGQPDEIAQAYRTREIIIQKALAPIDIDKDQSNLPLAPWPGFFKVMMTPKAYTSMLYLLMALPVGIFFFTWAVTGIALSLGLSILIIGIPFAIVFLGSVRILTLAEGRLVEALLDVRMPRRADLLPNGKTWYEKLINLLKDGHTWTGLTYLILHLPVGIISFVLVVVGLSFSFALIGAPISHFFATDAATITIGHIDVKEHPWILAILPFIGSFIFIGTLHISLAFGRLQGFIAKYMLVRR